MTEINGPYSGPWRAQLRELDSSWPRLLWGIGHFALCEATVERCRPRAAQNLSCGSSMASVALHTVGAISHQDCGPIFLMGFFVPDTTTTAQMIWKLCLK